MKCVRQFAWLWLSLIVLGLTGCETPAFDPATGAHASNPEIPASDVAVLRPGDQVLIALQSIPDPAEFQRQLDDQGAISLRFIGRLEASGLTASQLANRIEAAYLEQDIYRQVDVAVTLAERYVFVGGEVRRPGPIIWTNDLTLVKAITAAGGFGLYAKETEVQLNRDDQNYLIDARLAQEVPSEDRHLLPGDSLFVPKSPY